MGFSEFLGNERLVAALRGALRTQRVPHALLFTGPRGVGKYTLARMFAQAANCGRLPDDFCGECETCKRISLLAEGSPSAAKAPTPPPSSASRSSCNRIPMSGLSSPIPSG